MKNQLLQYLRIVASLALIILGCKMHADPERQTEKCRLISYEGNGIPIYWIYDSQKTLASGNYFNPGNIEVKYTHDDQGRLLNVVVVGEHILGDTLLADYTYDGNRLKTLRYYGRHYDINGNQSEKSILSCTLYYNEGDTPDSMKITKSRIDTTGREYIYEPIRFDKFFFDKGENLVKQETYTMDANGKPSLAASSYHNYDSKPNRLKLFKQINFTIDQSIPYIFSKNNLVSTRRDVPGKQSVDLLFKIVYDGDMIVDDGTGSSNMKWSCG